MRNENQFYGRKFCFFGDEEAAESVRKSFIEEGREVTDFTFSHSYAGTRTYEFTVRGEVNPDPILERCRGRVGCAVVDWLEPPKPFQVGRRSEFESFFKVGEKLLITEPRISGEWLIYDRVGNKALNNLAGRAKEQFPSTFYQEGVVGVLIEHLASATPDSSSVLVPTKGLYDLAKERGIDLALGCFSIQGSDLYLLKNPKSEAGITCDYNGQKVSSIEGSDTKLRHYFLNQGYSLVHIKFRSERQPEGQTND